MSGRCPTCGGRVARQILSEDALQLEGQIYELNRKIRRSGQLPKLKWLQLMEQHKQLVQRYRAAGGNRL